MADAHPRAALLVAGARGCVGARFRPLGRGPDAYDCVGVALAAAERAGLRLPALATYDLRWVDASVVLTVLRAGGFTPVPCARPGDLIWMAAGARQHFGVRTGGGTVEADAGLRRVVERPAANGPAWRFPTEE